jgi:hypothetical protein
LVLLAVAVAGGTLQAAARAAEAKPGPGWEYRVLSKKQVIDLGKKDLAAGLNQLGREGWELAAVDAVYIFKRPRRSDKEVEEVKRQVALRKSKVEQLRDRVTWAARMVKKGFLSEAQLQADRAALAWAEMALERARKDLATLPADPKGPTGKGRKPEK